MGSIELTTRDFDGQPIPDVDARVSSSHIGTQRYRLDMLRLLVVALVAGSILTACGGPPATVLHVQPAVFQMRPVLCGSPPFSPRGDTSPLPNRGHLQCDKGFEFTAANNKVVPDPNSPDGYTSAVIPPDPKFSAYRSTPVRLDLAQRTVLLPGPHVSLYSRYVLGPAELTATSIAEASATQNQLEQWVVDLVLTHAGSRLWDRLSRQSFHEYVAIVVNGVVITAPLIQPTQEVWSSFGGMIQFSGSLGKTTAQRLAAEL